MASDNPAVAAIERLQENNRRQMTEVKSELDDQKAITDALQSKYDELVKAEEGYELAIRTLTAPPADQQWFGDNVNRDADDGPEELAPHGHVQDYDQSDAVQSDGGSLFKRVRRG